MIFKEKKWVKDFTPSKTYFMYEEHKLLSTQTNSENTVSMKWKLTKESTKKLASDEQNN